MRTQFLIDAIVRQTTVLIAQLSTTGGVRAPLSHIAGQVFLDLAREIEGQGVGRKDTGGTPIMLADPVETFQIDATHIYWSQHYSDYPNAFIVRVPKP